MPCSKISKIICSTVTTHSSLLQRDTRLQYRSTIFGNFRVIKPFPATRPPPTMGILHPGLHRHPTARSPLTSRAKAAIQQRPAYKAVSISNLLFRRSTDSKPLSDSHVQPLSVPPQTPLRTPAGGRVRAPCAALPARPPLRPRLIAGTSPARPAGAAPLAAAPADLLGGDQAKAPTAVPLPGQEKRLSPSPAPLPPPPGQNTECLLASHNPRKFCNKTTISSNFRSVGMCLFHVINTKKHTRALSVQHACLLQQQGPKGFRAHTAAQLNLPTPATCKPRHREACQPSTVCVKCQKSF